MSNVRILQDQTAEASASSPLSELLSRAAFSQEAWHAMNARDTMQIEDEILHGAAEAEFVYAMLVQGKLVSGVSVIGARQLVTEYGGIKSRLVASTEKRGALFVFRSFEPLNIQTRTLHELEGTDDYYEVVLEVTDIKTGNSVQIRKSEAAKGKTRGGGEFERPHYGTVAESKAFRNGVLSLVPQKVVKDFKIRCLKRGLEVGAFDHPDQAQIKAAIKRFLQSPNQPPAGSEKTIDQLRDGMMSYAAKNAISIDRTVLARLTYAEIYGLGQAARSVDQFLDAAGTLGLVKVEPKIAPPSEPEKKEPLKKHAAPAAPQTQIVEESR